ncbi:unnamed protein product [Diamesa hyperborea]
MASTSKSFQFGNYSFENFTSFSEKAFSLNGWIPFKKQTISKNKLVYFWTSNIICIITLMQGMIYFIQNFMLKNASLLELTNLAPCMGFVILALMKTYVVVYRNQETFTEIIETLGKLFPKSMEEQQKYKVGIIFKRQKALNIFFSAIYMTIFVIFNLMPIFICIQIYYTDGIIHKEFPYMMWHPFDAYQPVVFEFCYLLVIWAAFTCDIAVLSTDLLYSNVLTLLCMQFDILKRDLEHLNAEESKECIIELKKKVLLHMELIEISEKLEDIFSMSILINFVGNLIKFSIYLFSSLSQILLMCYYGDQLKESSSSIAEGVYNSNWYNGQPAIKKQMSLVLLRAQRPQYLTAHKFSNVSLMSFTLVTIRFEIRFLTFLKINDISLIL